MALFGAAVGLASTLIGGIAGLRAAKKERAEINAQRQKNQSWFDRRYNEDATQRVDAQNAFNRTVEQFKQRNKAAAGSAAVMGATDESVAAAKEAGNQALANATSNIVANAAGRKDAIEGQYMQNDNAFGQQLNELERKKMENVANAVKGAGDVVGSLEDFKWSDLKKGKEA